MCARCISLALTDLLSALLKLPYALVRWDCEGREAVVTSMTHKHYINRLPSGFWLGLTNWIALAGSREGTNRNIY